MRQASRGLRGALAVAAVAAAGGVAVWALSEAPGPGAPAAVLTRSTPPGSTGAATLHAPAPTPTSTPTSTPTPTPTPAPAVVDAAAAGSSGRVPVPGRMRPDTQVERAAFVRQRLSQEGPRVNAYAHDVRAREARALAKLPVEDRAYGAVLVDILVHAEYRYRSAIVAALERHVLGGGDLATSGSRGRGPGIGGLMSGGGFEVEYFLAFAEHPDLAVADRARRTARQRLRAWHSRERPVAPRSGGSATGDSLSTR